MAKFFTFILFSLFLGVSPSTYALDSVDRLKVNILKAYSGNILVLDRGIEDGIFKRDHTKIVSQNGFIARGICIKTEMTVSHWKIYRVIKPELVSKDITYNMLSINQSQVPKDLNRFASNVDFEKYLRNTYSDKNKKKEVKLQQDRIVTYDLPDSVDQTKLYKFKKQDDFSQFLDRNLKDEEINRDFNNMQIEIFSSPITWQTRDRQEEEHYGIKIQNIGFKYQYQLSAIERRMEYRDPVGGSVYKSKGTYYDFQLQINRVTENMSLVSRLSYEREKIGQTYYPHRHFKLGFMGFRFHIWEENPKSQLMDITYTPVFDTFEYSIPYTNDIDEINGIRHELKLRLYSHFTKRLLNKTELTYSPFMNNEQKDFRFEDNNILTTAMTQFSWDLKDHFYFDYLIDYERDLLRAALYNIKSENTTQTIRFRYEWSL